MSLDVYLVKDPQSQNICENCGHNENICYSANITHNLAHMAEAAGIYMFLWRPEEIKIEKAFSLIKPLRKGLLTLRKNEKKLRELSPENGWGTYQSLVDFTINYFNACEKYPECLVQVSR